MKLYRIASLRHPIFSGVGAALYGGRWNSVGSPVIYAASSLALARLETLVHLDGLDVIPAGLGQVEITVPDDIKPEKFPHKRIPANEKVTKAYGDLWLAEGRSLILLVPSVASDGDLNGLINPMHHDFKRLLVSREKPVRWDRRLFGRG